MILPAVTRAQMIEVDRIMIEELGISLVQMMENAGRNLARLTMDRYQPGRATVLVGSGGNGGGGMVAARHLANHGVEVEVATTRPAGDLTGVPRSQMNSLIAMGIEPRAAPQGGERDVIVDALVGYTLDGPLRGQAAGLAAWAVEEPAPIISLDVPSGVDVDTGEPSGTAVCADATLTLALPKVGLVGSSYVGDLFLGDISVPPALYRRFSMEIPVDLFTSGPVIPI